MTVERDAVPAGEGNAPLAPGRRRTPPAGITTRCEELADSVGATPG
jgi:hypothetical protein